VQWLQAGNDVEYMIRGCDQAFAAIRGDEAASGGTDSYGQRL
jgi:hypothetical protein